MHEEFEVGHELDRALRSTVTGLAQIMERLARRSADQSRSAAAEARQEWLAQRDVARQLYVPWLRPGTVENSSGLDGAKVWAAAAAWSGMDPMAAAAERQLADRIGTAHGQHPSVLLREAGDGSSRPAETPAKTLLTMPEVLDLAGQHAPFYYRSHEGVTAQADVPMSPGEEALHTDWQHFAETGTLPDRSRWEAWAAHAGRGEEFAPEKWHTAEGEVDHESRDAALRHAWDEGAEERSQRELEEHQVALAAAGMGELRTQVAPAEQPTWVALMDPAGFDAASPENVAQAWRDARSRGVSGDLAAQAAAAQLGQQIKAKHGLDPDSYLLAAMTDRAANATEARRAAEDRARRAVEETRPIPTQAPVVPVAAAGEISRARVIELNTEAQRYFAGQLRPGSAGHRYLVDRLGDGVMQGPWALGYAPAGWTNLTRHLQQYGASDQEILGAGLGRLSSKGNVIDAFRDRAMVGIRGENGDVVGFVGRDLSGDERAPKYVNTGATPAFTKSEEVFGLTEAADGARIVRTEGAFDAMAVSLAGEGQAVGVAPLGTAMSDHQAAKIAAKAGGRVWLANDADKAGLTATDHDFFTLARHGVDTRVVSLPGGDPADAWHDSPELLRNSMATLDVASPAAEQVIDSYLLEHGEELAAGDPAAARAFDEHVATVSEALNDPVDQQLLTGYADRAREDLVRRSDEARAEAVALGVDAQQVETAADQSVLERRAERVDERGSRLEEASADVAETADTNGPAKPYDRAAESRLEELGEGAREARVVSSHGFSRSTSDAVKGANGQRGQAARPNRSGSTQRRGRGLSR